MAEDDLTSDKVGFFSILDGHGGADVSEYCAKNLPIVHTPITRFFVSNTKKIAATLKIYLKGYAKE